MAKGLFRRIRDLWVLSEEAPRIPWVQKKKQKVEFIMPNSVEEIYKNKPNATIDDVLV